MRAAAMPTLVALGVLVAAPVRAQDAPFPTDDYSGITLRLAPSGGPYLAIDSAEVHGRGRPTLLVGFDYGTRPLVAKTGCPENTIVACAIVGDRVELISGAATIHVGAAIAIADRVELGFVLPFAFVSGEGLPYVVDGRPVNDIRGGSVAAVADPTIALRARLYRTPNGRLTIGAAALASIPLGHATAERHYVGDNGPDLGLEGIGEIHLGEVQAAINLGGMFRPAAATLGLDVGTMMTYGAGVSWRPALTLIGAFAELEGATAFGGNVDQLEGRLGGRLYFWQLALTAGVGAGFVYGPGVPPFRAFATVTWTPSQTTDDDADHVPDDIDACPTVAEDLDQFADEDGCPESDNDGDHIPDALDHCRDVSEDLDNHEDADGCPDPDNDGDGVVDGYDSCPDTAEDMDGDRDTDGCPENDRDRDGIDDNVDQCPTDPEDTDGLADGDGCPETDADNDTIPDNQDQCPEDAETRNGNHDRDGCPEDAEGHAMEPTQHPAPPAHRAGPGTTIPPTPPPATDD